MENGAMAIGPQATAPILDSTGSEVAECAEDFRFLGYSGLVVLIASLSESDPEQTSALLRNVVAECRAGTPISVRLDAREFHRLGPFFGFVGDEFAEFRRRASKHRSAQVRKPCLDRGIGEAPE